VLISTGSGLFIGVQGGVTDLVKLVTHQVVAGQPSHMARWPWDAASTDSRLQIPYYYHLESVTMKLTYERLQSRVGRPRGLADRPPPRPSGQRPLKTTSSCQVHSRGDTSFGEIPNFL
jgi:hypothetical protein